MLSQEQFIRNYSVMADGEVDFFIGAGASIASGIPTGGDLIWEFKRTLFCSECGISTEKYKDLALPSTRRVLQDYFDKKGSYPEQYAPEEYSFYFEQCYSDPLARKRFIESIVSDREPSIGYLCLAEAVAQGKVKNVWTTNFDPLLENALHRLHPTNNILVCSEANRDSVRLLNPQYPVIGKLHGDYRYDWLRNTDGELQQLEEKLKEYAASQFADKQLVVIGYSGNDESIMSFLENCVENPSLLSKGLLWAIRKGSRVNPRVNNLLEKAKANGKTADYIEICGFDQLMFSAYQIQNYHNEVIDGQGRMLRERSNVHLNGQPVDSFVKLNAYRAEGCPLCNVFETDITSWAELRSIIGGAEIIAGFFSKHIYAFSSAETLSTVFGAHILSPINREEAPERDMRRNDSVYIGLVYRLIKQAFISKGMISFAKNKVYNPDSCRPDKGYQVFDALAIAVSYIDGNLYLNLLPTIHVRGSKGERLDKESYQIQVNRVVSTIYNQQYNEKLHFGNLSALLLEKCSLKTMAFRSPSSFQPSVLAAIIDALNGYLCHLANMKSR